VADSYTIKTAQQNLSSVVQEAADHPVTITNHGKAVAVMISMEGMEAIAETMEVLADPKAMAAIRKHREGREPSMISRCWNPYDSRPDSGGGPGLSSQTTSPATASAEGCHHGVG
jgi:prevent-host-death family protein